MNKLYSVALLIAFLTLYPSRAYPQGAVGYAAATSASGSLGAKLSTALGSALNNASKQTTQTVIKTAPTTSSQKSSAPRKSSTTQLVKTGPALVTIESTPPGAAILVDGNPQGITPATLSLSKGLHNIQVAHDGLDSWQQTLLLSEGATLSLKPILKDPKKSTPRFTVQR